MDLCFLASFFILCALIRYLSIYVHITYIIHNLSTLGVRKMIQVMNYLQDNK